ncbi:MAG: NAD-dependent epimerase/dehydratase family protein [Candidatus Latescibacterota bacterium]|nr:NAD-dependent epimerase/dehydratase family protein [Candidatus Latescibacterota bacterium]
MSVRTLITGATGFVGSHTVPRLLSDMDTPANLRALVRPSSDTRALESQGVELAEGDVSDRDSVHAALEGCRRLVHLANVYSLYERDTTVYSRVNIVGTRNVMECAADAGLELVVHISTVVAFGRPATIPFREDSPVGPLRFSEYARTKYVGDLIAEELARSRELPLAVLYPGSVLGAGDPKSSGRYVSDIVYRRMPLVPFANAVVTWVHVRDVAEAIARLLQRDDAVGSRYIIGKHRLTVHQINELIRDISGVRLPLLQPPDWMSTVIAALLTAWARATDTRPGWGLSRDLARTLRWGVQADGSRAECELGLSYTDIRTALGDIIDGFQ